MGHHDHGTTKEFMNERARDPILESEVSPYHSNIDTSSQLTKLKRMILFRLRRRGFGGGKKWVSSLHILPTIENRIWLKPTLSRSNAFVYGSLLQINKEGKEEREQLFFSFPREEHGPECMEQVPLCGLFLSCSSIYLTVKRSRRYVEQNAQKVIQYSDFRKGIKFNNGRMDIHSAAKLDSPFLFHFIYCY